MEIAAEAVAAAYGHSKFGYYSRRVGKQNLDVLRRLGRELIEMSPSYREYQSNMLQGMTHGGQSPHNTIQAFSESGQAAEMKKALGAPFGSGWHRDSTWAIPYEMSKTEDTLGVTYRNMALTQAGRIFERHIKPSGTYAKGLESVQSLQLPLAFHKTMVDANAKAKDYNSFSNMPMIEGLEGMSLNGIAAASRGVSTGFNAGWQGTMPNMDPLGLSRPAQLSSLSTPSAMTYTPTGRYDRWPNLEVTMSGPSLVRHVVDNDISRLQRQNFNRRLRDVVRKSDMAEMQNQTSWNMFFNAEYGAQRHVDR